MLCEHSLSFELEVPVLGLHSPGQRSQIALIMVVMVLWSISRSLSPSSFLQGRVSRFCLASAAIANQYIGLAHTSTLHLKLTLGFLQSPVIHILGSVPTIRLLFTWFPDPGQLGHLVSCWALTCLSSCSHHSSVLWKKGKDGHFSLPVLRFRILTSCFPPLNH